MIGNWLDCGSIGLRGKDVPDVMELTLHVSGGAM